MTDSIEVRMTKPGVVVITEDQVDCYNFEWATADDSAPQESMSTAILRWVIGRMIAGGADMPTGLDT